MDGIAKSIFQYDDDEIPLGISFWGEDGTLKAPNGLNWAKQRFVYDNKGRIKGLAYYGEREELVMNEELGFACFLIEYIDAEGLEKIYYFDADSNLIGESTEPPPLFKP